MSEAEKKAKIGKLAEHLVRLREDHKDENEYFEKIKSCQQVVGRYTSRILRHYNAELAEKNLFACIEESFEDCLRHSDTLKDVDLTENERNRDQSDLKRDTQMMMISEIDQPQYKNS